MWERLSIVALGLFYLAGAPVQAQTAEPSAPILFENVRIFDGKGATDIE